MKTINPCGKSRKMSEPYAEWVAHGWTYRLLKAWQADSRKEGGRWMVAVKSPNTFGGWDIGDEWVANCLTGMDLDSLTCDKAVFGTHFVEWAHGIYAYRGAA